MADKRLSAGWGKLSEALRTNRANHVGSGRAIVAVRRRGSGDAGIFLGSDAFAVHNERAQTWRDIGFQRLPPLLDIGGGSGAYVIELCKQYGDLRATVFELPHVAEIAAKKVAEAGLSER
ncbi:MAG TPA: methyltransferase [Rhizobiaceae bacterium]|nr:methyltransferase [Rhizobiaceae bacterium]